MMGAFLEAQTDSGYQNASQGWALQRTGEEPQVSPRGFGQLKKRPSPVFHGSPCCPPYLVQAALSLEGCCQLLLLFNSHLDHLMQELFFGFLGVQAALQGLPQVLQLCLQPTWGISMGCSIRGNHRWSMHAWGA